MARGLWLPKRLDSDKPLYLAIADALERDVRAGALVAGAQVPPQRDLAAALGVNLSTVTRAFSECRRRGLIRGTVGRGTVVTADPGASMPGLPDAEPAGGLIEMGLVLPLYACEGVTVAQIHETVRARDLGRTLRYAEAAGVREHREAGASWLREAGLRADPDNLLVTCGAQNALACSLLGLFKPGDRLAVEQLTYPGLMKLAILRGVELVPVRMDDGGIQPNDLDALCRRMPIRGLFLMPEMQNPTAATLSDDRRARLAALVKRHGLVLIEDDAYGFTVPNRRPALSARLPESSVYIAGISKALGAGLRVSFLVAPRRLIGPIEQALLATAWMASPLGAAVVADMVRGGGARLVVDTKRAEAHRRAALAAKLLPGRGHRIPTHGFFAWLALGEGWTGRSFELAAREVGVRVFGAERFCVDEGAAPRYARISLTGPDDIGGLGKGLDLLAGVMDRGRPGLSPML